MTSQHDPANKMKQGQRNEGGLEMQEHEHSGVKEEDAKTAEESNAAVCLEESTEGRKRDGSSTFTRHDNTHGDAMRRYHVHPIPIDLLDPPMSRREKFRDWILRSLDRPFFQIMGIIVMLLVVADGALFFFFLIGWQMLCDTPSKTDCSPRNEIYNLSIQILCWLFTYMVTVSMPWRCANLIQVFGCGRRDHSKGLDLYGRPTNEVWFHIDSCQRRGIIVCLLLNCLLQYANQATRIIFYSYELQDTPPGVYWVNVFFVSSFLFAAIGALWSVISSERLRKQHPGRFGPGAAELARKYWRLLGRWLHYYSPTQQEETGEVVELNEYEEELVFAEQEDDEDDPTHYPFNALGVQRAGLRLFAM